MKASPLIRRRVVLAADAFAEIVVWKVHDPVPPASHPFKYRLAYIVGGQCVLRYDNERGKGDHCHLHGRELPYNFTTVDALVEDFIAAVDAARRTP
jgi:hypothetical protein